MNNLPNFFKNRHKTWNFEDVLNFINENFEIKNNFAFRVGNLKNNDTENQRAAIVLAYAQLMNYTFNQVKALFSEHDHFAIAMPETRQGRNILEINNIYTELLGKENVQDIRINNFPEYFDIPKDILKLK
ncbi:MAG: hypothetical protein HOE19_03670 [Candidatus Komeilibacteria bacterium]|jgi:hypothetical protein|nr:hypothetical protein [Candidatus Komeilibacteria bacterium]MBT4447775.1 hypothetical protein [Candidatus Komeilibacteria bacterium]